MKNLKTSLISMLCFTALLLSSAVVFGQQDASDPTPDNTNTSITLKTMRALFPDVPVAVANELNGGLHVVNTIAQLHGVDQATDQFAINDNDLQVGMLVFVTAENVQMYYRYLGPQGDQKNDGTNVTEVNSNYWKPLSDIITDDYLKVTVLVQDKLELVESTLPTDPHTGDHLIIHKTGSTKVLGTYVYGETTVKDYNVTPAADVTALRWNLISASSIVYSTGDTENWYVTYDGDDITIINNEGDDITNNFRDGDIIQITNIAGNVETYISYGDEIVKIEVDDNDQVKEYPVADIETLIAITKSNVNANIENDIYLEGDLVKFAYEGFYKVYACESIERTGTGGSGDPYTYNRKWIEIANYMEDANKPKYKVYYGDGTSKPTARKDSKTTPQDIEALDYGDFLRQAKLDGGDIEISSQSSTVTVVYYPATWPDFKISIKNGSAKFELTNGISIETIDAKTIDASAYTNEGKVFYKKVTVYSRDKSIYLD